MEEPTTLLEPVETNQSDHETISWTASEFIAHQKSAAWYIALFVGALIIAATDYLIMHDAVSATVIIVAGVVIGIYGSHQPRQLEYSVDMRGFSIGSKRYSYDDFRSFSLVPEGAFSSIVFMPLKRFAIQAAMHYPPEQEDRILEILGERLPLEEARRDHVDNLMRRIRF